MFFDDKLLNELGIETSAESQTIPNVDVQEIQVSEPPLTGPENESDKDTSALLLSAMQDEINRIQQLNGYLSSVSEEENPELHDVFIDMLTCSNKSLGRLQAVLMEVCPNAENIMHGVAIEEDKMVDAEKELEHKVQESLHTGKGVEWEIKYKNYSKTGTKDSKIRFITESKKSDIVKCLNNKFSNLDIISIRPILNEQKSKHGNNLNEDVNANPMLTGVNSGWVKPVDTSNQAKLTLQARINTILSSFCSKFDNEDYELDVSNRLISYDSCQKFKQDFTEYVTMKINLDELSEELKKEYDKILSLLDELSTWFKDRIVPEDSRETIDAIMELNSAIHPEFKEYGVNTGLEL